MKLAVLGRLVCPMCGGRLAAEAFEADAGDRDTVGEGVLLCERCRVWYPVHRAVPVLLVFRTAFHDRFSAMRRTELARLPGYGPPAGRPRPGEESVQETFTEEWGGARESELSFTYSLDDLKELNRKVWLPWLRRNGEPPQVRSVLNVGCGLGSEAIALLDVTGAAELFAIDLNFALFERGPERAAPEGVHFVVASLFDLPFRKTSFDLVYSQGVLHHTFSTEEAFAEVASFVGERGYLFVWVYGRDDHLGLHGRRRLATWAALLIEGALRPLLSRSRPSVRQVVFRVGRRAAHPLLKSRVRHGERWEVENSDAFLRDWLSPRYAHRHGYNEVAEWFEQHGFTIVATQSPLTYRQLFGDRLWGVGLTGRRDGSSP